MKIEQLKELLNDFADHLEVVIELPNGQIREVVDVEPGSIKGGNPVAVLLPGQENI